MTMIRKQFYVTAEQDRAVKRLARRYRTTQAGIIRRALDDWLRREEAHDGEIPFAALIGFVDGPGNIDHNAIYG